MRHSEHSAEPSVGLCTVCGDRADGYHYGVLSCRGCNAFFRRAVAFNLQFHCRRDGHCQINKNARCACRACRLQKCRDMGMDPSAVQVRREVKDLLDLQDHRGRHELPQSPTQPSISSVLSARVLGSANMLDMPQLKSRLLGSIVSSVGHSPQVTHPLDRLVEWYFCQRYRRATMLCQTVEQILGAMADPHHERFPNGPATPDDFAQVNKVQMVLMFEWVEQLEEFEQKVEDPHHKTWLLRSFAPKYLLLDMLLHGLEQGFTDRIVLPNGKAISRADQLRAISSSFGCNDEERRRIMALEMMYNEAFLSIIEQLIEPMAELDVTFGELMALRLLLFWDISAQSNSAYHQPVSPALSEIARCASERALGELQSWYELHSIGGNGGGSGQRLETLLALLKIIKRFAGHLARITALIPDFAVMSEWQFIGDLMLG